MARPVDTPELARKREREAQMVSQMIALWCRGHHGGEHTIEQVSDDEPVRVKLGLRTITLCPECAELQKYAIARIEHCPHMGTKTFCSACPSHCYRPAMREKIREVMRWLSPHHRRETRDGNSAGQTRGGTKQVVAGAGTRRPAFPLDFGTRRARRVQSCTITMERIHQMQRSRQARLPAGRLPYSYLVLGRARHV